MKELIIKGAQTMGIELHDAAPDQLIRYHEILTEVNKVMNLTRVSDDPQEAVDRNYLDSLSPLSVPGLLDGVKTMCDVGSGAGFPGIPLSIARPDIHVVMMDSLGKRVKFLNQVIDELHLNAEAIHIRAEDAAKSPEFRDHFDLVTARAVAALPTLLELALPFVRPGGRMMAFKGPSLTEELAASAAALKKLCAQPIQSHSIVIPGRDWDHRLMMIRKTAPTPKAFPRKAGEAGRNPILK
ncbi:MAG: 16S rRNA (guanine(527)-N(7))-methyltransferase RsmG [Clostridia bacterium]|nr:16S rRNA (guanine(527)-N(7))-methyltransferase RsmG [Clostridia bacterium]